MATVESLIVKIGADLKEFDRAMKNTESSLNKMGSKLQGIGSNLTKYLTAPLAGIGLASLKMAADIEQSQIAFETMLGSGEKAQKMLSDLQKFAATTPFQFNDLQDAARKMLAFGIESENVMSNLEMIGNIAAGVSAPVGDLAFVFGQVRAQGQAMTQDLNQFAARGVPVYDEISKLLGITVAELRDGMASGKIKVNFEMIEQAFQNLTAEGGKFNNLMAKQSQSLGGVFSTLKDNVTLSLIEIGKAINETFNVTGLIQQLTAYVQNAVNWFKQLSPSGKSLIVTFSALAAAAGPLLFSLGSIMKILPILKAGFLVLGGPVTAIVAALAGAAALIIANWDAIKEYFTSGGGSAMWQNLQEVVGRVIDRIEKVITAFVGLAITLWSKFGDDITSIASGQFSALMDIIEGAFEFILNVIDFFSAFAVGDMEGVGNALKNIFLSAFQLINKIVINSIGGVIDVLAKLASYIPGVGDDISGGLEKASSFVRNFGSSVDTVMEGVKAKTDEGKKSIIDLGAEVKKLSGGIVPTSTQPTSVSATGAMGGGQASANAGTVMPQLDALPAKIMETSNLIRSTLNPAVQSASEAMGNMGKSWLAVTKVDIAGSMINAATAAIQSGKSFISAAKDIVSAFISQGVAAIIANTLKGATGLLGPLALPIAGAAGAGAAALFNKLIPAFANGGIVPGSSYSGDKVLARLNSGEMVLNRQQQASVFGGGNVNVTGTVRVQGQDLLIAIENANRYLAKTS